MAERPLGPPPPRRNMVCCMVCQVVVQSPAALPCGHRVCMRCIRRSGNTCPRCGRCLPRRHEPPSRFSEGREGEREEAAEEPSGAAWCRRHQQARDVYCCSEERVVCGRCAAEEHQGHVIGLVGKEREKKEVELRELQARFSSIIRSQKAEWAELVRSRSRIEKEARRAEDFCESAIVHAIDSLQRLYLSVKELIKAREAAAAAPVCRQLQALQVKLDEMKGRNEELHHLAQTESNVHFLQEWSSLRLLCEEDLQHCIPEAPVDLPLSFEVTKQAFENLRLKVIEICDAKFASISQTDVTTDSEAHWAAAVETDEEDLLLYNEATTSQSSVRNLEEFPPMMPGSVSSAPSTVHRPLTEPTLTPTTREHFLHYACEISLDPDTAHEDLIISEGDKKVTVCNQQNKQLAVRHPHRFAHRVQVLCKEALQGERCYYEVEVDGKKSEVALAYFGIDRKTKTKRSAFGASKNSWSLDRSTHYSVSHNGQSVQLTTPPTHPRIGVYLQFRTGTVSFYEVTHTMKFLYKLKAEFTEPLYPGFWLGDNCCITICDLTL